MGAGSHSRIEGGASIECTALVGCRALRAAARTGLAASSEAHSAMQRMGIWNLAAGRRRSTGSRG